MRCPFCGHDDSQVKDSRPTEDNGAIRRRRQCEACGARFTTFERIQLREVWVLKSEGRREPFERDNPSKYVKVGQEVEAKIIGEMVMEGLKGLDSVAYIRFASVYKDFGEARDFEDFASTVKEVGGE